MAGEIAEERLVSIVNRLESLNEEIKGLNDDKAEVLKEAKDDGFDTAVIKHVIKLRKMGSADLADFETLVDLYKRALGMLTGVQMELGASVSLARAHDAHAHDGKTGQDDGPAANPDPEIDPETGEVLDEDAVETAAEAPVQDSQFATDTAPDGNPAGGSASTGLDAHIVSESEANGEVEAGEVERPDEPPVPTEPDQGAANGAPAAPQEQEEEAEPERQGDPDDGEAVPVGPQHVARQAAEAFGPSYDMDEIPEFLRRCGEGEGGEG